MQVFVCVRLWLYHTGAVEPVANTSVGATEVPPTLTDKALATEVS